MENATQMIVIGLCVFIFCTSLSLFFYEKKELELMIQNEERIIFTNNVMYK